MNLQEVFEKNGWFLIGEDISYKMSSRFKEYVNKQENCLKLIFDTNGGNTAEALVIVDIIELWRSLIKGNVYAFCIGNCHSAGLIILSACDKDYRECSPNTSFLFHSQSSKLSFKKNLGLDSAIEQLKLCFEATPKSKQQQSKGFGVTQEKILELEQKGDMTDDMCHTTAEEAVVLGIIARIAKSPTVL